MIKSECIIELDKIGKISVTCPQCASELRLALGYEFSGICPSCGARMPANHINELRRCIYELQTNEILKSKNTKIAFINEQK